jgi:hypothetical protein
MQPQPFTQPSNNPVPGIQPQPAIQPQPSMQPAIQPNMPHQPPRHDHDQPYHADALKFCMEVPRPVEFSNCKPSLHIYISFNPFWFKLYYKFILFKSLNSINVSNQTCKFFLFFTYFYQERQEFCNQFLIFRPDDQLTARANGKVIAFGTLGVYSYNQAALLPTPMVALPPPPQPMQAKGSSMVTVLNSDDCKQALINWVDAQSCTPTKIAYEGTVGTVVCFNALDVMLTKKESAIDKEPLYL